MRHFFQLTITAISRYCTAIVHFQSFKPASTCTVLISVFLLGDSNVIYFTICFCLAGRSSHLLVSPICNVSCSTNLPWSFLAACTEEYSQKKNTFSEVYLVPNKAEYTRFSAYRPIQLLFVFAYLPFCLYITFKKLFVYTT